MVDREEVTSTLGVEVPGEDFIRALQSALRAMAANLEPTAQLLEEMLLLRSVVKKFEQSEAAQMRGLPCTCPRCVARSLNGRYGVSMENVAMAEVVIENCMRLYGLDRNEAVEHISNKFSRDLTAAGFDPEEVNRQINAAADAGDTEAATRIMNRVGRAVKEYQKKKGN